MAVTHFLTQFTHVSRHFLTWNRKKKKIGKTVWKVWSQKFTKITCFIPIFCQRLGPLLLFFIFFYYYFFSSKSCFVDTSSFFDKSETTFSKQFSLIFFVCFLIYTLKCLETCVNGVTKCITAQFYPLEVQIFEIIFLKVYLQTI